MQPIQINVQVNIGMDSALLSMLSGLATTTQTAAPAVQQPQRKPKAEAKPKQVNQPAAQQPASGEAKPEPMPEKPKEYTEVDIRAAMDRTRKRIEGEDYKEKPDSEGYKTWHKRLTAWFKNTAALCGAEKPSALPDSESRAKFIAACDAVEIKGDELTETCPF
jgi:hypothetical protein